MPLSAWGRDALSRYVLSPAYNAYRYARPQTRRAAVSFREGLSFRESTAAWSEDRRRAWMLQRLQSVVRRAALEIPFYRERFQSVGFDPLAPFSFDDYARVPILERDEVRAAGLGLRSPTVPLSELRKDATGGTSGKPTEIWLGPDERGWRESGTRFFLNRIGVTRGTRTALLWAHHLDPLARATKRERLQDTIDNTRWFDCLRLSPELLMRYHDQLQSWRPACIVSYAAVSAILAEQLKASGVRPAYPTHCFVTGAEKLWPHERALVHEVFGCSVHERYGSRDIGPIAFQLSPDKSLDFSVDWANLLVEPASAETFASVLVTKLHADGMPMLRYRLGDVAAFAATNRPGHPAFTLGEIAGREAERLWLPDGRSVHGNGFPHLLKDFPIAEFQVHQHADWTVTIRVVPLAALTDEHVRNILRTVQANLPGIALRFERVQTIARSAANKRRPVISEVCMSPRRSDG